MNFDRLGKLTMEIDIINALIDGNFEYDFKKIFEGTDMNEENKINKLCELTYRMLNQEEFVNLDILLKMFNDNFPENVGKFCVNFIKLNKGDLQNMDINETIMALQELRVDDVPDAQIKVDYLNLLLVLLLQQVPMNMEKINKYNNLLKDMMNR